MSDRLKASGTDVQRYSGSIAVVLVVQIHSACLQGISTKLGGLHK